MTPRPPRSTLSSSSAASDVYKRQPEVSEFLSGESLPRTQHELEDMHAWFGESDEDDHEAPAQDHMQRQPAALQPPSEQAPCVGLHKFLDSVKPGFGEQYAQGLSTGGFETGRALSLASAENLQQCGVALGHALLIVDTIRKVAKY
eukprot:TRINITY_DN13706_c0_g1_i2.p2 TRINITY_DN13706_c0_g1~~TRINITY_DN13706_c0_g1_i2.p2  ORF type:complete len:146 (+),score=42.50 TRINITY_DN13706_c0_g1_i2:76-513(+)